MWAALGTGMIAFFCVFVLTPVVGALSHRWKLYDPVGSLKIHHGTVPRLGGIALAIGLGAAVIFGSLTTAHQISIQWFAAFGVIWITGLVDDLRSLPPALRLVAQVGSGVILWEGGWRLPWHLSAIIGTASVCAVVILFVNAFNFLDGSDGLAAGIAAITGAAYLSAYGSGITSRTILASGLVGASLGFLWWNFPPASIFMGDSGSTLLGFCVACLSLDFVGDPPGKPGGFRWIFPAMVAAVPLLDCMVVILRRLIRGTSAIHGDRSHYYDRMLQRGWPARRVAGISYLITGLLASTGLWIMHRSLMGITVFAVGPAIAFVVASLKPGERGR